MKDQSNYNFKIHEEIAVISQKSGGWTLELNIVSFNGREPEYDLREWKDNHTRLHSGARFSESDLKTLMKFIKKRLEEIEHE